MPGRPYGFAPQIAMAIFGGAVIKDKKFAFLLPLLSLFISDALYELLYMNGIGNISGFYGGQLTNYLIFGGLTIFGFYIKNLNLKSIALASITAPTVYYIISNFLVWLSPMGGLMRPKTFSGLIMTLGDGLPFYPWSLAATVVFSALFFGSYFLMTKQEPVEKFTTQNIN